MVAHPRVYKQHKLYLIGFKKKVRLIVWVEKRGKNLDGVGRGDDVYCQNTLYKLLKELTKIEGK